MTKKAVLVYTIYWVAESETWVVIPIDQDHYSKIMTYIGLITQPDDNLLAESDDYDIIAAYEVSHQVIDSLTQSYGLVADLLAA